MSEFNKLRQFFEACLGSWVSERTYHYLNPSSVERSHTKFGISPLAPERREKVLADTHYTLAGDRAATCLGLHFTFHTISETGEVVDRAADAAFVPCKTPNEADCVIEGDYLRNPAYEEAQPLRARFRFDGRRRELVTTTYYTQLVSVDSIALIAPQTRIRRIVNYVKPSGE